jgi:chemotaxis protein methyltransferase CheR
MHRRVMTGLAKSGMKHLGEVQHRILTDPDFFGAFLGHLIVQVSEMFRDPTFYRAFRREVVPLLKTYPQVKVWHAGCASGQEVYSTAVTLLEEGLLPRSQIYATDISPRSIEQSRRGTYSQTELDVFEQNYAAAGGRARPTDFLTLAYGRMAFKESLRSEIVFFQHNLASDYALGEMQVIFCRNVLIYFGETLRRKVTNMFEQALCRGGFLCLGSSERPPDSSTRLRAFVAGQPIYRKVES